MTYLTCPTLRYHPAVVAQKAATLGLLSDNRFRLGLGSGENLNEHAVGAVWPGVRVRQDMLAEAITAAFAAASQFVTRDDVAGSIACGPHLDELAESVRPFLTAGFTDVAVVQIGDQSQDEFLATAAKPLLERLRRL